MRIALRLLLVGPFRVERELSQSLFFPISICYNYLSHSYSI